MGLKRQLHLWHRWLGIGLALFMLMWFVSGVVMMYVGYPKLSRAERLAALPTLPAQAADCCLSLQQALAAAGRSEAPDEARLTTIAQRPCYVVRFGARQWLTIDARTGEVTASDRQPVDAARATASAEAFVRGATGAPGADGAEGADGADGQGAIAYLGTVDEDPWTHSRALDAHRPLHRVMATGPDATLLYVSSATGEVVRDATATERRWNWVGAWIHWLYPLRGGALNAWWSEIVIGLSVSATVATLLGLVLGIQRLRWQGAYGNGSRSPYRGFMQRWHHWAGLIFGVTALTWIFSGLMSMNPWRVFDSVKAVKPVVERIDASAFALPIADVMAAAASGAGEGGFLGVVELEWRVLDRQPYYIAYSAAGATLAVPGAATDRTPVHLSAGQANEARAVRLLDADLLRAHAQRLMPQRQIVGEQWLTAYDVYYYERAAHTMLGAQDKRLPVVRYRFDDEGQTWLHLDPHTGEVALRLDAGRRTSRWLFAFLHSFDLPLLLNARPLWDALLIVLSVGGALISATGTVMGWRRLRKRRAHRLASMRLGRPQSVH